ncbi:hypothetical protein [Alicyclobacillus acidoterrestris]|uniref:Uncharacterized protein n=1 Tax=Alicyclobacillus acidoterrestris (strain ATCC 49025 / DSM 3922 / CIP 106132 / NCIMB 13137 / GD3B) TaxID=1356854 RepID=T0DDM1_ALIAG|nr:hypothetical protein [Alicyclobacillus acidoterrestris]EPZ47756.1 hypothetical protein N007_05740 [Alicyclobacillus acidoterrestris ATCC 49025]UNO47939.1 hypothetical protein K1I37_14790 [Alicyclobacillus acidoterrestris]
MAFRNDYKYFNKWFVVGTVTNIDNQTRNADGSSYGGQLTINTGSPSGLARVRIPNNRNVPMAYDALVNMFDIGSRVKVGFTGQWLRLDERESNGRTYRNFTQFHLPELAEQNDHNRIAGKVTGELISKDIIDDYLRITVEQYETDKDGNEILRNGRSEPHYFTFVVREHKEAVYDIPLGTNIEVSARFYNDVVRDDFGDIVNSFNEVRLEKFVVHSQPQVQQQQQTVQLPPQYTQPVPAQSQPAFVPHQQSSNPFAFPPQQQASVPFPGVGNDPFADQ